MVNGTDPRPLDPENNPCLCIFMPYCEWWNHNLPENCQGRSVNFLFRLCWYIVFFLSKLVITAWWFPRCPFPNEWDAGMIIAQTERTVSKELVDVHPLTFMWNSRVAKNKTCRSCRTLRFFMLTFTGYIFLSQSWFTFAISVGEHPPWIFARHLTSFDHLQQSKPVMFVGL